MTCDSLACFHLQLEQLFASSSGSAPYQAADECLLSVLPPCSQTPECLEEGSPALGLCRSWIRGKGSVPIISWALLNASGKVILLSLVLNILFEKIFPIKFS